MPAFVQQPHVTNQVCRHAAGLWGIILSPGCKMYGLFIDEQGLKSKSGSIRTPPVLARVPQTSWLTQQTLFVTVEAGKSKSKVRGDLIIGEGAPSGLQMAPPPCLLT